MNEKLKGLHVEYLFRAVLCLETMEECYNFFEDLCTVPELNAMEQRFDVALLLDEGRVYTEILEKTGASSATISRVNRCLVYGGGYRTALDRLKEAGTLPESGEK